MGAARLAVRVMADISGKLPDPYAREMPGWDIPSQDYNVTNVDYTDFHTCEVACGADAKCQAWTYVIRGPKYASCCLKKGIPAAKQKSSCTSGVKNPDGGDKGGFTFFVDYVPPSGNGISTVTVGVDGGQTDTLKLLDSDKSIDMRLYVDNTFT